MKLSKAIFSVVDINKIGHWQHLTENLLLSLSLEEQIQFAQNIVVNKELGFMGNMQLANMALNLATYKVAAIRTIRTHLLTKLSKNLWIKIIQGTNLDLDSDFQKFAYNDPEDRFSQVSKELHALLQLIKQKKEAIYEGSTLEASSGSDSEDSYGWGTDWDE